MSLVKEAHLLKKLKNPFIPEIFDLEEDDDFTYIIEQFIEGESLKSLCSRQLLTEHQIFRFITQITKIIDYLHSEKEGILYLDIKPENILVAEDGCYLIDFGSARSALDTGGPCFGTRFYASPEQKNGEDLTGSSDLYSLGVLLGYMIDHGNISPKTEKALRSICERLCSKKRWNRIVSAKALLAHIDGLKNKTNKIRFSDKTVKIAFAGTERNTGVTYISLLFSAFLKNIGRKCIWAEANGSEAWYSFSCEMKRFRALAGLGTVSRKTFENGISAGTDIIADYGSITDKMPEGFYESDIVFILTGSKAWETEETAKARALSRNVMKKAFLVNLTDKIERDTALAVGKDTCAAIPYIHDPDMVLYNEEIRAVFRELAVLAGIIVT